uniref:KRAB domain-containing protein n=1 Tax=Athene cunicularia TaxID=194338 RepID=A0A663M5G5_ATHCN
MAPAVFQEPVAFEDVAVYFSAEEWRGLAGWQKGLYKEVMMENYQLIASLGSAGPKPEVVLKLEQGEEPLLGDTPTAPIRGSPQAPSTGECGEAEARAGCSVSQEPSQALASKEPMCWAAGMGQDPARGHGQGWAHMVSAW